MSNCSNKKCCKIGSDRFGANDGYPHAGWTYDDKYGIANNADRPHDTANEFLFTKGSIEIFNTYPVIGTKIHVSVKIKLEEVAAHGAMGGIIVGWLDNNNFLYVTLTYGRVDSEGNVCNYLEFLYYEAGGSYEIDAIPIALSLDTWYYLHVCYLPDTYAYYCTGTQNGDTLRASVFKASDLSYVAGGQVYATGHDGTGFTGGAKTGLIEAIPQVGTDAKVHFKEYKVEYFRDTSTHKCCRNCNTPCPIFSDSMNYGALSQGTSLFTDYQWFQFYWLTCFWAVQSGGTASFVVGNGLKIQPGTTVKCRVPHPQRKTSLTAQVDIGWAVGLIAILKLGSGYAKFDEPANLLKLYDNANNLLDSATLPDGDNDFHTVTLCYESGTSGYPCETSQGALTATFDNHGTVACTDGEADEVKDPYCYLKADAADTSGALGAFFKNFFLKKHKDTNEPSDKGCDVCECPIVCSYCLSGYGPELFKVVIPDDLIKLDGATRPGCTGCPATAGTYIIANGTPDLCIWNKRVNITGCNPIDQGITLRVLGPAQANDWNGAFPGTYRIQASFSSANDNLGIDYSNLIYWMKDYGATKPDCLNLVDESLPWVGEIGNPGAAEQAGCTSSTHKPLLVSTV